VADGGFVLLMVVFWWFFGGFVVIHCQCGRLCVSDGWHSGLLYCLVISLSLSHRPSPLHSFKVFLSQETLLFAAHIHLISFHY